VPLDLLPFLVASVLATVVPGADMALVTRQVLVGGTGLAQRTIFGNLVQPSVEQQPG
jgi:threonine/homoserine/homoserine lactone efflux protein